MKTGILYPRSNAYPEITTAFTTGIKACMKDAEASGEVQFFMESVGFGASEKEVYEKAEKLLLLENVDILVGFIDLKVIALLQPLLQSSGKLMLVVNPGANFPDNWTAQPNFIYLTLQEAFLCRLTGAMASPQKDTAGVFASGFYDCGYGHTPAMVNGFVKNGGDIGFNYIKKQSDEKIFSAKELMDFLTSAPSVNTLLCVYDAAPAAGLYSYLENEERGEDLQLYVSPLMLEKQALAGIGRGFRFRVNGYLPWIPSADNSANTDFISGYSELAAKDPCIFSLLGWETGLVLYEILAGAKDNYADGAAITARLVNTTLQGPRGAMELDPLTHYYTAPFIRCHIKKHNPVMETTVVQFPHEQWNEYIQEPTGGSASGWTNTYLCY